MAHPYTKLWIHAVFSTKNRQPLVRPAVKPVLYDLIRQQLQELQCRMECVNGVEDHVHILFLLSPQWSVADVMKQVKGSSSHEVNRRNLLPQKFAWQTGYGAFSVSESQVERRRAYIQNQEEHHRRMTFSEEYERFLRQYGLDGVTAGNR
ncbi:IS200/IS605 family transposase [Tellurirhabdus rosea]|uniref:IS200/IS605 family transposase n=1 Tax=Tellurirhabdus rosea TaxID=2674997 RepID=UPI00225108AE|nr:IS200/IS605 family transposase [Tellurirhabdus rosea]